MTHTHEYFELLANIEWIGENMKSKTHTELLDARCDAQNTVESAWETVKRIMGKRGWKYHSSNPGSYWMWEKNLKDGRTVIVDLDLAVKFEIEESGEYYDGGED